ncbi:MAG: ABC transporter permease [Thermoproteaceae archaeon]|jgi:ABC-2 type transport system permease protein|nr:ABC transporter permease [Thermoproteaceae archaeon]
MSAAGTALKAIRDALIVAWVNGWIAMVRGFVWVLSSALTPLSILVVLAAHGGLKGLKWGLVGGLIWIVTSSSLSLIGDAAYYRVAIKYQSMLVASPTSAVGYAIGLALSALIFALPALLAHIILLALLDVPALTLESLYALATLWLATAGMAFAASGLVRHMKYAWSVPSILSAVMVVCAPVYYPATLMPSPYLGVLLPTGAAGIVLQHSARLATYSAPLLLAALLSLTAQSIVGLYCTARLARWRER